MKINDKYLVKNVRAELAVLKAALESAQLSGTGELIDQYEQHLATFFNSPHALAQSSGSAALHTALYCLGVREGDEVLIPGIAPIPTVLPLLTAHATPVVVDIEKNGLGFDVNDLKKKITKKTKAAVLVPLWGYPIQYKKTLAVLRKHRIPLIEDTAQAHGAKIAGQYMGTFGTVGCFSTHDRKLISTGEGGFILTKTKTLYQQMKQFSQLGYMDGKTYGVNYKLSALQAHLGSFRLGQVLPQIAVRQRSVATIEAALQKTTITSFPIVAGGQANYYALVLLLPWNKATNFAFIQRLSEAGIPSDIVKYGFCPIYKRPMFRHLKTSAPNTEWLIDHLTTVPVHPGLTKKEVQYIANTLVTTYQEFTHAQ